MDKDSIWIQKIAGGDRTSFEELFHCYQRRLFGYVFRMLGDASQAEEVTGDVLFEVWKGAKRFGGRSRVSTWIFGIAHHKVIDELRRRKPQEVDIEDHRDLVHPDPGPENDAIHEDERIRLMAALAQLTPEHREVIELTFLQGCSVEDISAIIQCPAGTVKTRMFYARRKLREIFEAMGIGER